MEFSPLRSEKCIFNFNSMIEKFTNPTQEQQSQRNCAERKKLDNEKFAEELADALRDMHQSIYEKGKEIMEVIPQNRNFDIELVESRQRIQIKLKHRESKKEINLEAFLPPKCSFVKGKHFTYNRIKKLVEFPENAVEFRGFLLSLFHEIGHANEKKEHNISTLDTLKALYESILKLIKSISVQKEVSENDGRKKTTYKFTSLTSDNVLPNWYLDKRSEVQSKSERGAWAYALKKLRDLEREGYDVFAGFKSVAEIQSYVAYCLYTYDTELFLKKLFSGNLNHEESKKLYEAPAFWKGSKKYN